MSVFISNSMPGLQYRFVKDADSGFTKTGKAALKFRIINQRADFSFVLFSGGLSNVGSLLYCYYFVFPIIPISIYITKYDHHKFGILTRIILKTQGLRSEF